MPYIEQKDREKFDNLIEKIGPLISTQGELNYIVTRLAMNLVNNKGGKSYHNISSARSALIDASDEMYRRVMAPYEDIKIAENGDVPEYI